MLSRAEPADNDLLRALSAAESRRLLPYLERYAMPLGRVIQESGRALAHVYFPASAVVSLLHVMKDGASTEIAIVGHEGVVGVSTFMGGNGRPGKAVVQSAGESFRLPARRLLAEFSRGGLMQQRLLRYTQALITQMAQTGVCNRHHSIEQQLCRWLLFTLDRLPALELSITQELIAGLLGVRREGISAAAGKLQNAGVIEYRRGRITVLDRRRLEGMSCECYGVVREEEVRLSFHPMVA